MVCPNVPSIEFTCIGVNVSFLEWQINGEELQPNFDIGDSAPMNETNGPYTLYLDALSRRNNMERVANMTTRLLVNIASLNSGDRISCAAQFGNINSAVLNYTIRGKVTHIS